MKSDVRVPYLFNMVLALLLIPLRVRSISISCSSDTDTGTSRNTRASIPMVTSRPPLSLPRASQTLTLEPVLGRNQEFRAPSNNHSITQIKKSNLQSIVTEDTTSASPIKIPVRTQYDAEATVHILRASPKLWNACKSNCHRDDDDDDDVAWSPSRGIQAAEDYNQWTTGRHHLYPTTDIPAKDLPNGMGDAAISLATNVILPSMALAFDTPLEHLYFKDMFLAKYEPKGTGGQPGLGKHTDGSEYSFNMLLSDPKLDFQGGGTWIEPVGLVKPELGDVLMHRGSILHEGCPVTDGARYVLVGFVQSDEDDNGNGNGNVQNKNLNAGDKRSELLLKHLETFPLGMVVEVDEGDEIRCATIVDVLGEGGASAAGLQRGDCIRGILASEPDDSIELIGFDGKSFDEVMEILVELSGSVQMVVERWCS